MTDTSASGPRVSNPVARLRRLRTTRSLVRQARTDLAEQRRTVRRLAGAVERQGKRLDKMTARLRDVERLLGPIEKASDLRALEHGRFSYQIGAMEKRVGGLEERISDGRFVADSEDEAEARRLIDEIRREHEQIRVRMQVIGAYEERLRRVEATVAGLDEGDPRHLV
jgi:chromosome segregation ATPase